MSPLLKAFLEFWTNFFEEVCENILRGELIERFLGVKSTVQYINLNILNFWVRALGIRHEEEGIEPVSILLNAINIVAEFGFFDHILEEQQLETIK